MRFSVNSERFRPIWCVFNGFWWWRFYVSIVEQQTGDEILTWTGRGCANSTIRKMENILDKQINLAVKMCGEKDEWPLDSLKFLLKKAKINEKNIMKIDSSKSKAVLQKNLLLFCNDVLLKKLEHQKIEIMNEIMENVSAYKIYVEKD